VRAILVVTYDEAPLDDSLRSLYDDDEVVPGEPHPGRKLVRDMIEEAKAQHAEAPGLPFTPEFPADGIKAINVSFDNEDELVTKTSLLGDMADRVSSIPAGMAMIRAGLHQESAWRERSEARLQMLKAAAALEREGKGDDAQLILEIVTRQQREEGVIA
jgi:hypothetical protein